MKKEQAFAHKRKVRDKANLRWIKNRHLVMPGFMLLLLFGGLIGGTIANSFSPATIPTGVIIGMLCGVAFGSSYIMRDLGK